MTKQNFIDDLQKIYDYLDNEKAKPLYEKMVLEHADSLYYTESRKQYRALRGDATI